MVNELRRALPTLRAVPGSAEAVPLPDASVDAVLAGNAMHWFDMNVGGYPDGLAGDSIPLIARIVSVCDAYEAMITTRAYATASTSPEAIVELRDNAGTQFDPKVVDAFVSSLEKFGDPLGG